MSKKLGYTVQNIVGAHAYDFIMEYNSNGEYQWDRIEEVLNNPESPPIRTLEIRCKNSSTIWMEVHEKLLVMPSSNLRYTVGVGIDVSEQLVAKRDLEKVHTSMLISVFFNNALEKAFTFTEISQLANSVGIAIKAPIVCLFLHFRSDDFLHNEESLANVELKQWMIRCMHSAVDKNNTAVWESRDGIAGLVSLSSNQSAVQQIVDIVGIISKEAIKQDFFQRVKLGVSDVWLTPENIVTPYKQARESAIFGPFISPGQFVYHWKELGVMQFLVGINKSSAAEFIEAHLGPLLALPFPSQTQWLQTLGALLSTDSVSCLASRLLVHRKTIAYRRDRLEKLLQADFANPVTRTNLLVAWWLYQVHKPN